MVKKFYWIIIFLICGLSCLGADKNIIALFDMKDVRGRVSQKGAVFCLLLFAELSSYDSIKMVERKQLEKIMQEKQLNRSSLANRKYLELAALVNADYIVTGRIYEDEDEKQIVVNLKLTKCSNGNIFGKSFATPLTENDKYLQDIAKKAAAFIAKSLDKKTAVEK
jgi:hypothetical protein